MSTVNKRVTFLSCILTEPSISEREFDIIAHTKKCYFQNHNAYEIQIKGSPCVQLFGGVLRPQTINRPRGDHTHFAAKMGVVQNITCTLNVLC